MSCLTVLCKQTGQARGDKTSHDLDSGVLEQRAEQLYK